MANLASRDLRSSTGSNLKPFEEYTGINSLVFVSARLKLETVETSEQDKSMVNYLFKLLDQRQISKYNGDGYEKKRLSDLIDSLCVN